MSSISTHAGDHGHDGHGHAREAPHIAARAKLDMDAVTPGSGMKTAGAGLMFMGIVGIVVVAVGGFSGGLVGKQALASYHMGFLYALGIALGALGLQMILQQFNAGWGAAVRRTAESTASMMWVVLLLFLPILILELFVTKGMLFKWMDPAYTAGDIIYTKKKAWLDPQFWAIRAAIYFFIWIALGSVLYRLSRKQDENGDRWITAKQRWISSFGLLLFALSTAFASFDWLMSLDYHWFSTMFGVYFFAGSVLSSLAVMIVVMCSLRASGKYGAAFTKEHQHDLGKLMFAFTVFWAYVTFCQYFLIWYSNIPEETAFYNLRKDGGYMPIFVALCLGHFLIPFVILLVRDVKRNPHLLRLVALWILVMHAADLVFMVRPIVKDAKPGVNLWLDIAGVLGPALFFIGAAVWKMSRGPLIPIKDPRLHEVLGHKNYV